MLFRRSILWILLISSVYCGVFAQQLDTSFLSDPNFKWDSADYYWEPAPETDSIIEYVTGEDSLAVLAAFDPFFKLLKPAPAFLDMPSGFKNKPLQPAIRQYERKTGILLLYIVAAMLLLLLRFILPFTSPILKNPFPYILTPPMDEGELKSGYMVAVTFSALTLALTIDVSGFSFLSSLNISQALSISLLFLLLFSYAIVRVLLAWAIGYLFQTNRLAFYAIGFIYYEFVAALFLLPLSAALIFNPAIGFPGAFFIFFLVLMGLLLIVRLYRAYVSWLSSSPFPIIELLLYFCALELIPFLLVIQFYSGSIS